MNTDTSTQTIRTSVAAFHGSKHGFSIECIENGESHTRLITDPAFRSLVRIVDRGATLPIVCDIDVRNSVIVKVS